MELYSVKDIENCFPWISASAVNYRINCGYHPIQNPSTGTGIPNMFTLSELVHCAILDDISSLGGCPSKKNIRFSYNTHNPCELYEKHNYRVNVILFIVHKDGGRQYQLHYVSSEKDLVEPMTCYSSGLIEVRGYYELAILRLGKENS